MICFLHSMHSGLIAWNTDADDFSDTGPWTVPGGRDSLSPDIMTLAITTFLPIIAIGVWLWYRPILKKTLEKLPTDKTRPSAEHVEEALKYRPDPKDDPLFFLRII